MVVDTSSNKEVRVETEYGESGLPVRLLTVREVARYLGVHSNSVRRWEKMGLLKSYAIGLRNNLRFAQEEVLDFLKRCQKGGEVGERDARPG